MPTDSSERLVLLHRLADEFAARYRRGERPALQEYIDRHPDLADDMREYFPALVEMEQVKEGLQEETGAPAAGPLPPLERMGDYRILREIGRGGMGLVYEAEQLSLGRHVALKVLARQRFVDDRTKRRFEREARAAARLHHTNIVPVFGVGEQDGLPYYVMQFIQGLGLDEVLTELKKLHCAGASTGPFAGGKERVSRRELSAVQVARSLLTGEFQGTHDPDGAAEAVAPRDAVPQVDQGADVPRPPALSDSFPLSSSSVVLPGRSRDGSQSRHRKPTYWQSVASIGVQVAQALEYAHKQGIKHRDIKPSNLLLDTQGTVWVTDFGLAKADDQQNLTHTGDILGTLRYMPPEAFEGRSDARSDVYSLGLTLYEMLAFRPAFDERERNRLIKQVTHEEPTRLGKLNRSVPRDLETIVHKAIDREPGRRYQTAAALAADLQRFLDDEPIQARRVSQTEQVRPWCRHNPVVAGLTAALVLVFLSGFAAVAWKWQEAEGEKHIAQTAEQHEAEQRAIAQKQADLSRRLSYASDMSLAYQAWEAGDIGRARTLLFEQRPPAGLEDLRNFEWRYLWSLCQDGSRQTLREHTQGVRPLHELLSAGGPTGVAIMQDGKTLVASGLGSVCIWDLATQRHVKLLGIWNCGACAPDGKTLALVQGQGRAVCLWDVAAHCERAIFTHESLVGSAAYSPDGKLLAAGCWDNTVWLWDVPRRKNVAKLQGHKGGPGCLAFSPDGRQLASGSYGNEVLLWDVDARRQIAPLEGHTSMPSSLSFSPDGKLLASASTDGTVRLWDTATQQAVKTFREPRSVILSAVFSPRDGKTLATGGSDGTVRLWDVETMEVTALFRGHTAVVTAVAFAPDGRSLVSASRDGRVKVWDATAGQDPNILSGNKSAIYGLAFSPDGKTLAVVDNHDLTVKLWDLASRQFESFKGHTNLLLCVAFSPDGKTLASGGIEGTSVRLWDVASQEQLGEALPAFGNVVTVDFSPNGKFLAAGQRYGDSGRVWDLTTRKEVARLNRASRVRFSPDGRLLAASSGDTIQLWTVGTWQPVAELPAHTAADVVSLAFAPNSRTLAAGDAAGTLWLWDVVQQLPIHSRKGHTSEVGSLAFAPDGRRLATSGGDCTVTLWDAALLREVGSRTYPGMLVESVAFAPDGNTLAVGGSDGAVRLWQPPSWSTEFREPADAPMVAPDETFHLFFLELPGTPQPGTARATRSVEENNVQRVDVSAVDGTDWHVQLLQMFDDLQEGATYTVKFRAKADAPRSIRLAPTRSRSDFHRIEMNEVVSLTPDWQRYQYDFQAKDLAFRNTIQFNLGERTGTVWIADFTVTKREP
jgi:WD40 repeat protein/serine/threonine protein kinase